MFEYIYIYIATRWIDVSGLTSWFLLIHMSTCRLSIPTAKNNFRRKHGDGSVLPNHAAVSAVEKGEGFFKQQSFNTC